MKAISIFLITLALIAGMVGCDGPSPEIWDWYDLDAIRDNLDDLYLLMDDLDSTTAGYEELASPTANGGNGWEPIGTPDNSFTGIFDGQGFEIRDLFINRPNEDYVGFFGYIEEGGVLENVSLVNGNVTGGGQVGSLVGVNQEGTVGKSYSTGSVTGDQIVGGLVGQDVEGTVSDCYSASKVTGWSTVGGLVGLNGGTMNDSYSTGSVTGDRYIGGLVGWNGYLGPGTVSNSYSAGNVTGNYYAGGLVGHNQGGSTVSDSFWDTETSGQSTSAGGTGKTTAEMQDITTFLGATWDIVAVMNPSTRNLAYIWNIVDDETYPFLSWEPVS